MIEKYHQKKLAELHQFLLQNGHCYVPKTKEYIDLYQWTLHIRQSRPRLSQELVKELEALHFDWKMYDTKDLKWLGRYYELLEFKKKYGHTRVTRKNYPEGERIFIKWIYFQREVENKMLHWRKKLLDDIGFLWSADIERILEEEREQQWLEQYQKLKDFYKKNGHSNFTNRKLDKSLVYWMRNQRQKYDDQQLSKKQIKRLKDIDFVWDVFDYRWEEQFKKLKKYQQKYGHSRVTKSYNKSLYDWTKEQRKRIQLGVTTAEQKKALDSIGFLWADDLEKMETERWFKNYNTLKNRFEKEGALVYKNIKPTERLGTWITSQRIKFANNKLKKEHIQLLNDIQFYWDGLLHAWEYYYEELKSFQQKYGHTVVSLSPPYIRLHTWWERQLKAFENGQLLPQRKKLLDDIGFLWEATQQAEVIHNLWMEKYHKLKTHFEKNGVLPRVEMEDKVMSRWIEKQKWNYKNGKIREDYFQLLDNIGLVWEDVLEQQWKVYYEQLKKHKKNMAIFM